MTRGIYAIRNTVTGENYIGASGDIEKRFKMHRSALERGVHGWRLQQAWEIHGADAFELVIIEADVPPELINEREKYHIAQKVAMRGSLEYNGTRGGGGIPLDGLSRPQRPYLVSMAHALDEYDRIRKLPPDEIRAMLGDDA